MDLNNYLFYFLKDNEIKCEKITGKRHPDCIEEVSKLERINVTDGRTETLVKQMIGKGYIAFMIFGRIYLFLPDELNEKQINLLKNMNKEIL